MERVKITVDLREGKGKEASKKLKQKGVIPAVVYSDDLNLALSIPAPALKVLRSIHFSEGAVIDMTINGEKKHESIPVLIKDVQFNPLSEDVIHIDFLKVSLKEKIKVHVPIVVKGESKSVKEEEGVLDQVLREVEIEALPLDIPKEINVDVSELTIGHSLHVEDLKVPGNVKIITDPQETIVTIVAKEEEIEPEAAPEEAAPVEPEVIKEKKEGEEEKGAEEEEKPEKAEKPQKQEKQEKQK